MAPPKPKPAMEVRLLLAAVGTTILSLISAPMVQFS